MVDFGRPWLDVSLRHFDSIIRDAYEASRETQHKEMERSAMKKNPIILLVLGLVLLAASGLRSLTGGPSRADAARALQCRERMKDQGSDMLAKCDERAFATAMTAADASSAAQAISAANNSEVSSDSLSMFLLGLGGVLTVAGLLMMPKRSSAES